MRWRGQRGSSDWPMWTVRSHGASLVPGQALKSTWLPSWQMSEGLEVKDNNTNAPALTRQTTTAWPHTAGIETGSTLNPAGVRSTGATVFLPTEQISPLSGGEIHRPQEGAALGSLLKPAATASGWS